MPEQTFFNLPEEKREKITQAAMDEFAGRSFHQARITAIIEKAGIARGSFYQYFEDKKDLFKYIIELCVGEKLKYINQDMIKNRDKYGFFELLREIYLSGIRFAMEQPRLLAIGNKLLKDKELQQEVWGEHHDTSTEFFKELLEEGLKKDELDPAIDVEVVSKLLTGLNYSLIDIIYKEDKIDQEVLEEGMEEIDKMIYFIENGIKKKE